MCTVEGCASAGAEADLPSWLDGGSSRSLAALPASCCLAGEALEVAVGVHNPLALELALTHVRLLFEHDGGGGEAADAALLAEVGTSFSWRGVKMLPYYSTPGVCDPLALERVLTDARLPIEHDGCSCKIIDAELLAVVCGAATLG